MTTEGPDDRRYFTRVPADIEVDYRHGDTFLFSYIENISEMGIFIRSEDPLEVGTRIDLRFSLATGRRLELRGEVMWINPFVPGGENLNPGMGVRFLDLDPELRETLVDLIQTIAYLQRDRGEN